MNSLLIIEQLFCWRLLYHRLEPLSLDVEGPYGVGTAGNIDTSIAGEWRIMNYPVSFSLFVPAH